MTDQIGAEATQGSPQFEALIDIRQEFMLAFFVLRARRCPPFGLPVFFWALTEEAR